MQEKIAKNNQQTFLFSKGQGTMGVCIFLLLVFCFIWFFFFFSQNVISERYKSY